MRKPIRNFPVALYATLLLLSCCVACTSVQLIAPYDSNVEKGITALQSDTETFLVKVARAGKLDSGTYKEYTDFYDKEKVAISGLQFRAGVLSHNQDTIGQIAILSDTYAALEKRHKERGLTDLDASQFEIAFNRTFRAILTLEIAKKSLSTTGSDSQAKQNN